MPNRNDPIRQQVIAARRKQILDGAARVFAEKGYHNATNKDIAEAADVSYGTIYNYFTNKADLLIGILNQLDGIAEHEEHLAEDLTHDFPTAIEHFLMRHITQYVPNLTMFSAILPQVLIDDELRQLYMQQNVIPTQEVLEKQLTARVERGELKDIDVKAAAHLLYSMLFGSMVLHVLGDGFVPGQNGGSISDVIDLIIGSWQAQDNSNKENDA